MAKAISMLSVGIAAILLVAILGTFHTENYVRLPRLATANDYQRVIFEQLISYFNATNIALNLRAFTSLPHPAGTAENAKVADKIAQIWTENGLEDVHFVNYEVLLSYPFYEMPNHLSVLGYDGRPKYTTKGVSPPLIPEEQGTPRAGVQWVAYSGDGTVEGDIVYCHYGRDEDFEFLQNHGIGLQGKIAMLRYGHGSRVNKVRGAQMRGAIGAILFSDPDEVARAGTQKENVYPNTEWMPNDGVQRGTLMHGNGDPLTPLYPAKKSSYRSRTIDEAKAEGILPLIPVLPISYTDANRLLTAVAGEIAPYSWQGGLNVTYRTGPGLIDASAVRIVVRSMLRMRTIRNVVGYIRGAVDPDQYIILGNHYDAWVYGSVDPNSGTAILAEVASALVKTMLETTWRPARTIMFCNWDAEEYGLLGSTEFVEEFAAVLQQRAVVYLNVDNINSNQTLHVSTVPSLYEVAKEAATKIPNPMESERKLGRQTVFDTWINAFPSDIPFLPHVPSMPVPVAGSDHAPFLNYLGVPVIDFKYRNVTSYDNYPLYHSLYETPFTNEHLFDTNNLAVHMAVGRYWAALAHSFSDSAVLPFNISNTADCLAQLYIPKLKSTLQSLKEYTELLNDAKHQLGQLIRASKEFVRSAHSTDKLIEIALEQFAINPYDQRNISALNQRLITVERCFINDRGMPNHAAQRHVLYSISDKNSYQALVMGAAYDQIVEFKTAKSEQQRRFHARALAQQIAIVQYSIKCAINAIADHI